ncbi:D-alanine--D-alanine ligase [Thiotrichales bacterium 19S3-7]|nr:D-alanine--D-alanine ligase [Thiotrichales bacterium 19S3-7]MCF6802304.1 D-alanine--D-alanine ligase [Thiotrichales bacterium 19S3-11]
MNQNKALKLNIAVLFGGISIERDISIASTQTIIKALRSKGHTVTAIDTEQGILKEYQEKEIFSYHVAQNPPDKYRYQANYNFKSNLFSYIKELKHYDLVFIALHGQFGEDGHIQAVLELANIPYTGSNVISSALAMNKHFSKRLVQSAGIITPNWRLIKQLNHHDIHVHQFPIVVKPNTQGSSIAVNIAYDEDQFQAMIEQAFYYDNEILIEDYIQGREFTIGVLDDQALSPGEIITDEDTFNYYHKYQQSSVKEIFPAKLDQAMTICIKTAALTAHHALGLSDYSRIDFMLDEKEQLWFLEANSLPGLTPTSLYPQSANAANISIADALEEICFKALGRYRRKNIR